MDDVRRRISGRKPVRVILLAMALAACGGAEATPIVPPASPTSETDSALPTATQRTPLATATYSDIGEEIIVDLLPRWIAGETRTIELTKGRTQNDPDGIDFSGSSTTPVEITVLEQTADGYVVQWLYGETKLESGDLPADPIVGALSTLTNGMRFEYEIDPFGIPIGLRNWEEIQSLIQEVMDELFAFIERQGMSDEEIAIIREQIEPMVSGREQIEALSSDEISVYHLPLGGIYELSAPIPYNDLLPNFFGGDPFPAQGELTFVSYDPNSDRAVIQWTQILDAESAREILMQTMIDLAQTMGTDPPQEADLPDPFSIEDSAEYVVDVASGWVISVEYQREIVIGSAVRVDTTRIVDTTD
jgi:hypothetical protein